MKRKIFSKLLMGALLVASVSSFTSCKDYDDDINGLKDDVAKRALLSDVTALQTTVSGVKSTAEQALEKATAAATATDLATVKGIAEKAATDAAKGIKDAADANTAAAAAQKAADEAKAALADYAKTSDLADYVKNSDLETKLADYVTSSALAEAVAAAKQQIETFIATSEGNFEALKADVEKFKGAYNQIWNAVTSVSLYAAISPAANATTGTGSALSYYGTADKAGEQNVLDLQFVKDAISKTDVRFTRGTLASVTTVSTTYATDGKGLFGDPDNKDYFNNVANYSASKVTYKDKGVFKFPTSIIVRVSPTSAVLTKDNISIIDGKGAALSLVEVESVEPYSTLLTRSGSASGLWKINLNAVDDATAAKFLAATLVDPATGKYSAAGTKQGLFAVAINNTASVEAAAERNIVSEYGLTVHNATPITDYTGVYDIYKSAKVNDNLISGIGGRDANGAQTVIKGAKGGDYKWSIYAATSSAATDADRSMNPAVMINNGGKVTVDLTNCYSYLTAANDGPFQPQYFYVVRDDANAGGSDASELNAWKSYVYDGNLGTILNPATEKCEFTITIPETMSTGDYIGFRIFAVNYDGTLCDPDGVPFEVWVGASKNAVTATGSFVPNEGEGTKKTIVLPISGSFVAGTAAAFNANADKALKAGGNTTFTITGISYHKTYDPSTGAVSAALTPASATDAKFIKLDVDFGTATKWSEWVDGTTVEFTSTTNSAAPAVPENSITITLTKQLPDVAFTTTTYPYSWKAGQLKSGVYTAYLYPETASGVHTASWTTAATANTFGYQDMNSVINGLATTNYEVHFANAKEKTTSGKTYYTDPWVADATNAFFLEVKNAKSTGDEVVLIDNTTQHDSWIAYNYGEISSEAKDGTGAIIDYKVTTEEFKTVFACPLDPKYYTLSFKTYDGGKVGGVAGTPQDINYIYYGENASALGRNYFDAAGNKVPAGFNATLAAFVNAYTKADSKFDNAEFGSTWQDAYNHHVAATVTAELLSKDGMNADYFTVVVGAGGTLTFTPIITSDPGKDIPSILRFKMTDGFGHENVYDVDITVKTTVGL